MRVLVTGGAGYVGSVLVPRLLAQGHRVAVFDSLRYGGQALLPSFEDEGFHFVRGDVRDAASLAECVRSADIVVHLAAVVGYPACMKHPELARQTNVDGTRNVVAALSPSQLLVYASTGSSYGKLETVCTEESPLQPISLYAMTKSEGEALALGHPRTISLRFATAFGVSPRMRMDLLINDFVHRAVVDKQLIVYEPHFRRAFVHVRDMAGAVLFAIDRCDAMIGRSYNVGDESLNLTKEHIARKIRDHVAFYLHFADVGHDVDERDYLVSYERIRELGFHVTVTLEQGIRELARVVEVIDLFSPYSNR
jgi:nucleoside-diphosphate-sugar epimerase